MTEECVPTIYQQQQRYLWNQERFFFAGGLSIREGGPDGFGAQVTGLGCAFSSSFFFFGTSATGSCGHAR